MAESFRLVVVGGGPGGIATAIEWVATGGKPQEVLVLEKGPGVADAIKIFYPEKKMTIANYKGLPVISEGSLPVFPELTKAQTLTYFEDLVREHRVNIRFGVEVTKIQREGKGFHVMIGHDCIEADNVAIGIGILGRPNKPSYKIPNSLRNNILYDMTTQEVHQARVLVVGGGDTSCEFCQLLVEEGNTLVLAYRGAQFSRMMEQNRATAERLQREGKLEIRMQCEVEEVRDHEGKPQAVFKDGKTEVFDKILYAMGGTTPINFLKTSGVECIDNWPKVGAEGETNQPGLYLVGDLAVGKQGGSILTAYNSAFRAVRHMRGRH